MTVSFIGHCPETGMVGGAITSSSICVASRCLFTRSGVGAVLTQNVTDPSLGKKMLDLLAEYLDFRGCPFSRIDQTQPVQAAIELRNLI